jgi:hypothetical protein
MFFCEIIFAQYTESQVLKATQQVIDEEIKYAEVIGEKEKALRDYLNKVMLNKRTITESTKFLNQSKSKDKDKIFEAGFQLMMIERDKSMNFLSFNESYQIMNSNIEILGKMNSFECSQYIKRKSTEEQGKGRSLFAIAGTLDIDKFKNYINLYSLAYEKMLNGKLSHDELNENDLLNVKNDYRQSFIKLINENSKIGDFVKSKKTFNEISDAEVCLIGKEIMSLVVKGDNKSAGMRSKAYVTGRLN